jgi:hypothetical protein
VDDPANHSPSLAVFLRFLARFLVIEQIQGSARLTISSMRKPPLTTLPKYMSGRDE